MSDQPTPRERNAKMIEMIRAGEVKAYVEGDHVLRVLAVPGRRTGLPRTTPIAVTQVDGQRYVCSPNRHRDWTANLLAAGTCEIEQEPGTTFRVELLEDERAAEVLHTYLGNVRRNEALRGSAGPNMWPFAKDAPPSVIREHLAEIAVLRLSPVTGG
ncbi:deazaflavin-dependent oxidoreductase (nitroreductase family) [Crossiella equi]|uniref:Deazaflavin-dependent oxidoreductase (Nitroreductase family) n=1 Tax=Crossiella equi TaxID=130796 RepID=A0ABS5AR53_9PSEU|nr:nitroreductase/quinone reductase family protein [Crossiella equi]MBP2479047.1 deazaflavin-dependent oxidoreductase (nitroreductase family) [Crossiella equi]